MRKLFKNGTGITLVALIITIVILLILAGISIARLTANGLFEKTKLAKEKQENAQELENETLIDYENLIGGYKNISNSRDSISNESTLITSIDFEATKIEAKKITFNINAITQNTNDAVVYYIFCNGKVVTGNNSNIVEVNNLDKGTEYVFKCGIIDINGNIKISSEKRYRTINISIDDVDALDYALITSTGIYNCKVKNSNEYFFFKEIQLTGNNAIGYEGYDNDLETNAMVSNTVDVGYIYVDESAIGKKILLKNAVNCIVHAMNSNGNSISAIGPSGDCEMVIPENTKYLHFTTNATRLGNLYFSEIMIQK